MPSYTDALRGYAFEVLKRDGFKCRYCGLDGTHSFANWLALTSDHLLPKGDPRRDDPAFIIAACAFCNYADNHYFEHAAQKGLRFDGLTADELIEQRLPFVKRTRDSYEKFWMENVAPLRAEKPSAPSPRWRRHRDRAD